MKTSCGFVGHVILRRVIAFFVVLATAGFADRAFADRDYELEVKKILKRVEDLELTDDEGQKAIDKAAEAKISRLDIEKEVASASFGGRRLIYIEFKQIGNERIHCFADKFAFESGVAATRAGSTETAINKIIAPKLYFIKDQWIPERPPEPQKETILSRFYSVALLTNQFGQKQVKLTISDKDGRDISAEVAKEGRLKNALAHGIDKRGAIRTDSKPLTREERFKAVDGRLLKFVGTVRIGPDAIVEEYEVFGKPLESYTFLPHETVSRDVFPGFGNKVAEGAVYRASVDISVLDRTEHIGLALEKNPRVEASPSSADQLPTLSGAKPMTNEERFKSIDGKRVRYDGVVQYDGRVLHKFEFVGEPGEGCCFAKYGLTTEPVVGAIYMAKRTKGGLFGRDRLELKMDASSSAPSQK